MKCMCITTLTSKNSFVSVSFLSFKNLWISSKDFGILFSDWSSLSCSMTLCLVSAIDVLWRSFVERSSTATVYLIDGIRIKSHESY